jgi:cytoskeleton protein RodZ|tara:strand:- start:23919 stop:25106 length:1188 start_codon:yes stop_codon:yes gene_type:complete
MSEENLNQNEPEEAIQQQAAVPADAKPKVIANAASAMLLEARSRAGFTQKEVADQLFLMTSFIRHIDEGRFDKLPKPAFVKGYLRSYARVVDLSGDEVVANFEASQLPIQDDMEMKDVTDEPMGSSTYTGPVFLTGAVGFAGVVIITSLVWIFSDTNEEPTASVVSQNETVSNEVEALQLPSRTMTLTPETVLGGVSVDQRSLDQADSVRSDEVGLDQPPAAAIDSEDIQPEEILYEDEEMAATFSSISVLPDEIAAVEPEAVSLDQDDGLATPTENTIEVEDQVAEQLVASAVQIQRGQVTINGLEITTISAGGEDELFFQFSDNCWVEIVDAKGVEIYADLNRDGDALRVSGVAPYSILLGKGPSVSLQFNGETVDVGRYTSSDDTAKLRLGR